jgi:hypothetical protein
LAIKGYLLVPMRVFWGDTHVHSILSGDAFDYGGKLTPDDAY